MESFPSKPLRGKQKHINSPNTNHAWRIIPVRKWLITMVSKSPNWGCSNSKWPKLLINGGDPNYLRTGMILQVAAWLAAGKNWTILEVERVQGDFPVINSRRCWMWKNKAPPNLCFAGWKKFQTIHSLNDDFTVIDESHCRNMSKIFKNQ